MKRLILVPVMVAVLACGGSPLPPANAVRAASRAAVDVAKDAFVLVADACLASKNPYAMTQCAEYLGPARDLIVSAAGAVDTQWSSKAACDLAQATALVSSAVVAVDGDANVKMIADDAVALARSALGTAYCALPDAGAPDAAEKDTSPE